MAAQIWDNRDGGDGYMGICKQWWWRRGTLGIKTTEMWVILYGAFQRGVIASFPWWNKMHVIGGDMIG